MKFSLFRKTEREDLEQLRSEFTRSMQELQQSLRREREQLRSEFITNIQALEQSLLGEIRRVAAPPDLSSLRTTFTKSIQALEQSLGEEIRQRATPSDLTPFGDKLKDVEQVLLDEIQQTYVPLSPELSRLPETLEALQGQVQRLVTQLSPVLPSGESKPIHDLIKVRIDAAFAAIHALETDHATWLDEQYRYQQDTRQALDEIVKLQQTSMKHILPSAEVQPIEELQPSEEEEPIESTRLP